MKVNYFFFVMAIILPIPVAQAQGDAEQFIWQQESRYIQAFRDADHKSVMALWHNNFLGWPQMEKKPISKQQGRTFLNRWYRKSGQWEFAIEPQSIQITNDIAITQYLLKTWSAKKSNSQRIKVSRIVHTWLKQDGKWKIMGGMSAPWTHGNK